MPYKLALGHCARMPCIIKPANKSPEVSPATMAMEKAPSGALDSEDMPGACTTYLTMPRSGDVPCKKPIIMSTSLLASGYFCVSNSISVWA